MTYSNFFSEMELLETLFGNDSNYNPAQGHASAALLSIVQG